MQLRCGEKKARAERQVAINHREDTPGTNRLGVDGSQVEDSVRPDLLDNRDRGLESITELVNILRREYGIKALMVLIDDCMNLNPFRGEEFDQGRTYKAISASHNRSAHESPGS
jgi:hypothetical protein